VDVLEPELLALGEVLGGEHLHGLRGGDCGADRVGSGAGLTPQGALDEVHLVSRAVAQPLVALDAQQHAVRRR
jgi:hypothetical protein